MRLKILKFIKLLFGVVKDPALSPYRAVVNRWHEGEYEHIVLDCGHHILISRHTFRALPCDQCREQEQETKK